MSGHPGGRLADHAGPRRAALRDPTSKLLGLLDFSVAGGESATLEDSLGVLLLSLMGEFAAPGASFLLRAAPHGRLQVRVAKGRGAPGLLGRVLPGEPRLALAHVHRFEDLEPQDPLREMFAGAPPALLVPIRHHDRLVGLVGLAGRAQGRDYEPGDHELLRYVAAIAGTVVANHALYEELRGTNRKLRRHLFDLHALFDVSRDLNTSPDVESVCRILAQTAMAHVLVSKCLIAVCREGGLEVVLSRGIAAPPRPGEPLWRDPEELREAFDLDQLLPLRAGADVRAHLGLGPRKDGRPLAREDVEFLSTLGSLAITAIDSLRLHQERVHRERIERELAFARTIQAGLFPRRLPRLDGWGLAAASDPCYEVGGDYYDALEAPSGLLFAVGDVSGKGVPAALLMSMLQATIRALGHRKEESPISLLETLNTTLCESTGPSKFVTFFVGLLDPITARLRYANAGHNPPLLLHPDGTLEKLTRGGMVLGILPDAPFEEGVRDLEPGDLLVVYTDGVTEAADRDDEQLGEERLERLLRAHASQGTERIIAEVFRAVREHGSGLPRTDDVTVLALRREAGGPAREAA